MSRLLAFLLVLGLAGCDGGDPAAIFEGEVAGVEIGDGFGAARLFWWSESVSEWIDDSLALHVIVRAREAAREEGGSALVEFCPLPLKAQIDVWGQHPQGMEVMRRIKQNFDPLGILSPGRFVGRL